MDELKNRSEHIEREAWTSLYAKAPGPLRQALGLGVVVHRGVTLLSASRVDHLLLNRAIGLGDAHGTTDAIATTRHYANEGVEHYWIHLAASLRGSSLASDLCANGVVRYPRSWMKFAKAVSPVEFPACAFQIRAAGEEDVVGISRIVAPSFDLPAKAGPLLAAEVRAEGWDYFVAEHERRIVAAAALFASGRDALLAFAATDRPYRGRGAQQALMAARLARAADLGCAHVFTETGMPKPGERGSSYRNILRAGFDELYVRDNFASEGTEWKKSPSSDATERSRFSRKPSSTPRKAADRSGS